MTERNYIFSQLNIVNVSEAAKMISPDMGFFYCATKYKDGQIQTTPRKREAKEWKAVTVTEAEVRNDDQFWLVVHYKFSDKEHIWECTISPANYKKWKQFFVTDSRWQNRNTTDDAVTDEEGNETDHRLLMVKRRLLLLNDLLLKNHAPIRMREYQATKHVSLRMTERLYNELSAGAKTCEMDLSKYALKLLDGKRPKAALTKEELALMKAIQTTRSDFQLMENAIYNQLKGLTKEEIFAKVIEGKEFDFWRRMLLAMKGIIDDFIRDNHITDAAVKDYVRIMSK